jgi:outer membrane immunogenic protein
LALSAGAAAAADVGMPVKAPAVAPLYSWTGFYAGIHGGYAWGGSADAAITPGVLGLFPPSPPAFYLTAPTGPFGLSTEPEGWFGGGQIGYNWQMNQWLVGVEADISFGDISDSASGPFGGSFRLNNITTVTGAATLDEKVDYFGTLRLRLGLLPTERLLIFATGGVAYGHAKASLALAATSSTPPAAPIAFAEGVSVSNTDWGWVLGGGFEWAFADYWTLSLLYLFVNLDTGGVYATPSGAGVLNWHDVDLHTLRLALSYRFWTR